MMDIFQNYIVNYNSCLYYFTAVRLFCSCN